MLLWQLPLLGLPPDIAYQGPPLDPAVLESKRFLKILSIFSDFNCWATCDKIGVF